MTISFAKVESIVKSLPIGYYAKRKVPVFCDRKSQDSYYDLLKDTITISYPSIAAALEKVELPTEKMIRGVVYHELSHALISPKDIEVNPIINVFEDERIETRFEGYYLDVDFKENIRALNGWDGKTHANPNDPFSVFYHALRYRDTAPEKAKWIEDSMKCWALYGNVSKWYIEQWARSAWWYITETSYDEYVKEHQNEIEVPVKEIEGEDEEERGKEHDNKKKAGKKENPFNFNNRLISRDDNFTKAISILFDNFNKKTQGGAAYQTYSGVINPRNIAREDYRYFDRLAKQVGNNKFGSIHLNLFLDVSGSFKRNEDEANQVLKALCEMEDTYKFFSFDVIACGIGQKLLSHHNRAIECDSGTRLTSEIEPLFRKLQKNQTMNYNIVMYDGDCAPGMLSNGRNAFNVFDKPNCFIISDDENESYIAEAVKTARVVISQHYVEELKNNVLKALQLALS